MLPFYNQRGNQVFEDDDEMPEGDFYECTVCGINYQFVELEKSEEWKHEAIINKIFCCNCKSKKLTPMKIKNGEIGDSDAPDSLWVRYAGGQDLGF